MRFYIALWVGKFVNFLINIVDKSRGSNLSGEKAMQIAPDLIKHFKGIDYSKVLFVTGSNGKSTTTNLIYHVFAESGRNVASNLEGANLITGIATALIKNSTLTGKIKPEYCIFEVDERFLRVVHEALPAGNILVTNVQKDQAHRNGDPDFVFRKILPVIKKDVRLFLNNDEPRSRGFAHYNKNVVTYGVEKHNESFQKDDSYSTMACPICHHGIEFKYYNNDGMGAFECKGCDSKSQEADYLATCIDFANRKLFVKDAEFVMPYNTPYMLYNYAATVAASYEIGGIAPEQASKAFKTFKNIGGRFEVLQYGKKTIKYTRTKQEGPETMQNSINAIASDKSPKMVCIGLGNVTDVTPNYTNTCYAFDCDFSELERSNVEKYLVFTRETCYDAANRLIYEGISPDKIEITESEDAKDILEFMNNAETDNIYLLTLLYTFEDIQKQVLSERRRNNAS